MVERRSPKPEVAGSIPVAPAKNAIFIMIKKTKAYKFLEQVKQEAQKVVWPQKKELITSVLIVIVVVFLFGVSCMVLDYGIHSVIKFLLNLGK